MALNGKTTCLPTQLISIESRYFSPFLYEIRYISYNFFSSSINLQGLMKLNFLHESDRKFSCRVLSWIINPIAQMQLDREKKYAQNAFNAKNRSFSLIRFLIVPNNHVSDPRKATKTIIGLTYGIHSQGCSIKRNNYCWRPIIRFRFDDFEKSFPPYTFVFFNLDSQNLYTCNTFIHYVCTMENSDIKISDWLCFIEVYLFKKTSIQILLDLFYSPIGKKRKM